MLIIVTILINVGAIAAWSFITGQNGFKEAAKMLRGEPAFIRKEDNIKGRVIEDIEKEAQGIPKEDRAQWYKDNIDWVESIETGEQVFKD